jgi:hypothetical protein
MAQVGYPWNGGGINTPPTTKGAAPELAGAAPERKRVWRAGGGPATRQKVNCVWKYSDEVLDFACTEGVPW